MFLHGGEMSTSYHRQEVLFREELFKKDMISLERLKYGFIYLFLLFKDLFIWGGAQRERIPSGIMT